MTLGPRQKMIATIAGAFVLGVGVVTAAVVTGVFPRTATDTAPPQAEPPATKADQAAKHTATRTRAPASRVATAAPPPPPVCTTCGVVEAINTVTQKGQASGGGAVVGGLLGGVLGHQIGRGRGNDLATVAGAIGGAVAGNEIEKNAKKVVTYRVDVLMDDGRRETLSLAAPPSVAVGDHVRIVDGVPVRL